MGIEDIYDIGDILNRDRAILNAIEEGTFYDKDLITKDWKDWYKKEQKQADKEFDKFQKQKRRSLDEIIEKYSFLVGLKGESYNSATKMIFYCILSDQLKMNFFTADTKEIDLRIPLMLMIKAGHGKLNYEYFIRNTIEKVGKVYSEPTSFHPEQFIGKIIVKEHKKDDDEYIPVYGILASDFVVIDEGKDLLTGKTPVYQESLKYIRYALDPIGSHQLEKKQVNVPYNEQLRYYPHCGFMILTQPISNVNEELLLRGSFRRFVILIVNSTIEERNLARRDSKLMSMKKNVHEKSWDDWIIFNKELLKKKNLKFIGEDNDFAIIDDYIDEIMNNLKDYPEALEYANSNQYNLKFIIFKMAAIRAIVEQDGNVVKISRRHIESAIIDHKEFWDEQIKWISQQLILTSDKPIGWKEEEHGWIISGLTQRPEGIKPAEFTKKFMEKYEGSKSPTTLKNYIYRSMKDLKRWGMAETTKDGKLILKKEIKYAQDFSDETPVGKD